MKKYKQRIFYNCHVTCMLLVSILFILGCTKEKIPAPSNLDNNYFIIFDNPNDPVDHAIYEFYKSTGVASFYSDSIYKKQVSKNNEFPIRYTYVKLAFNYNPLGNTGVSYQPLTSKKSIPGLLNLLEEEMIPKLPSSKMLPSILFMDSFKESHPIINIQISHGYMSWHGYNTVGIQVRDVAAMNMEERKMYAASILAGIAAKRLRELYDTPLQKDFFSITRKASKDVVLDDIYFGNAYLFSLRPNKTEPQPNSIGFLFHPTYFVVAGMTLPAAARESDDLRAFLTAVFFYTSREFEDLYPNAPLVLEKFKVIRKIAIEAGFKP